MILTQTLQQVLPQLNVYTSSKNFNGELWMSLSIFRIDEYTPSIPSLIKVYFKALRMSYGKKDTQAPQVLLLEYGIDHPGEMEFLLSIAKPNCAVHTQIDSVHSEQFWNPENIAKAELLLEENTTDIIFLNTDDPYAKWITERVSADVLTYSANKETEENTLIMQTTEMKSWDPYGQTGKLIVNWKKVFNIQINLLWRYHLSYAGVWVCLADILSYRFFNQWLQNENYKLDLHLQPGRRSSFPGIYGNIVIDSTYNASPRSVKNILQETTEWRNKTHPTHKLVFVLGDMRELWTQEKKEHEQLAEFLQQFDARLFLVWKSMKEIVLPQLIKNGKGRLIGVDHFTTYEKLGKHLQNYLLQNNDEKHIIVFKWSQNTIFLEEAVKYILQNKEDEQHLTRQSNWRKTKKEQFLKSVK